MQKTIYRKFVILMVFAMLIASPLTALAAPPATGLAQDDTLTCEETYTVQADDWLSKLADKYYGDVLAYTVLADATNAAAADDDTYTMIENPDVIEIGWNICVPSAEDASTMMGDEAMMDESMADDTAMDESMAVSNAVTVEDQTLGEGNTVTVASVTADVDGWIVIHAQADGAPGPVIGNAAVTAGENSNVSVEIDSAQATETLYAMLHVDEGEAGVYEFPGPDGPAMDADGNVVTPPFALDMGEAMMEDESMEEMGTIVDIAMADDRFETLVAAVQAAGLVETLQGEGPFTVFAPTDDAFDALPEGTLDTLLADPSGDLTQILLYHAVSGKVMAADVVGLDTATTVQGSDLSITVDGDSVMVNDANVIITDIEASNGVIHVIDAVLLPPTE